MEGQVVLFMVAVGAVILLIACAVKGCMEWILDVLMRGLLGAVGIHFFNLLLSFAGISLGIGVNSFSLLTICFLGIPGFVGLYILGFYRTM